MGRRLLILPLPAGGAPSRAAGFPGRCMLILEGFSLNKTFCSPGYPALPEGQGPRSNHPRLRSPRPESPDGTYSEAGALLRGLPALLPEPSASGPRLRGIHCQSCPSGPAAQRRSQKRWRLEDQRERTLVRGRWCLAGRLRIGGGPPGQKPKDRGGAISVIMGGAESLACHP